MNAGWTQDDSPFHAGEQAIQTRLGVRDKMENFGRRVIRDYLPEQHREFYALLPFLIVGTVDDRDRPWASILSGRAGFIASPDPQHLHLATQPLFGSPIAAHLHLGMNIGILGILPETRRRNRANGHISGLDESGITIAIAQTFGNCPQYIQTRELEILPEIDQPQLAKNVTEGDRLDAAAQALISQADTFFIASTYLPNSPKPPNPDNPAFGADVSHRGGAPGFVKVEADQTLIFPDFSGNFHFNTLGNLLLNPQVGLLFIDFATRDLLYLTGTAEIIWEGPEVEAFIGAERFVRIHVQAWRRVTASLPIAVTFGDYSPNLEHSGSWAQMTATLAHQARAEQA